jgi:hypothetical protein
MGSANAAHSNTGVNETKHAEFTDVLVRRSLTLITPFRLLPLQTSPCYSVVAIIKEVLATWCSTLT